MGRKQRLEMDEDCIMEQKTWQVYSFGKRNVFGIFLTPILFIAQRQSSKSRFCSERLLYLKTLFLMCRLKKLGCSVSYWL